MCRNGCNYLPFSLRWLHADSLLKVSQGTKESLEAAIWKVVDVHGSHFGLARAFVDAPSLQFSLGSFLFAHFDNRQAPRSRSICQSVSSHSPFPRPLLRRHPNLSSAIAVICLRDYRRQTPVAGERSMVRLKRVIYEPPTVRITGRHRPDRGTIGGSGADRDYRMSTYGIWTKSISRSMAGWSICGAPSTPRARSSTCWFRLGGTNGQRLN
jgi:hypothetical protein